MNKLWNSELVRVCFMSKLSKKEKKKIFAFFFYIYLYFIFGRPSLQSFPYDNEKPLAAVKGRRREIIFFIEIRLK